MNISGASLSRHINRPQGRGAIVESLCDRGRSIGIVSLNAANDIVEVLSSGGGPVLAHLRPQYFLDSGADVVMLHELATVGSRRAEIYRFDEAGVILQVAAQNLLPPAGGPDLREPV